MDSSEWNVFPTKISRNAPCPCGSGKKYKKCCGANAGMEGRVASTPGLPEGVTEFWKEPAINGIKRFPSWRMELALPGEDEWADEDAVIDRTIEKVVEGFLRPYVERHACVTCFGKGEGEDFQIAILQTQNRDGEGLDDCPNVRLLDHSRMYDVFREKLGEFFANFFDSPFVCELSRDMMYGGPILTLEDDDGLKEVFMVAIPDTEE